MKGFKEFLMQGNLIELAVAFIMGQAFSEVVSTFAQIIVDAIGLIFNVNAFSSTDIGGIQVGAFISAVIYFFIVAFAVYFGVVMPYQQYKKMRGIEEAVEKTETDLLVEIRDLLAGPSR